MRINIDLIYPVGSIYLSTVSTSPQTLFGGSWTQIKGYYLYAGTTGNSSYTGTGTQSHTLTVDQMPSHTHDVSNGATTFVNGGSHDVSQTSGSRNYTYIGGNIAKTGGGKGHSHNVAYYQVYCWKRTA